jgi:hypothetical protein
MRIKSIEPGMVATPDFVQDTGVEKSAFTFVSLYKFPGQGIQK